MSPIDQSDALERTVGSSTIVNAHPEASLPPAALNPVVQESTPALIARQLRRAIGEGELAPGQQLNEAALSRSLGVSRGPLREAMQRLTQEGLLVSVRNRGVFVIEVTDDDVRDMYLARTALERAAAAHAAETDPAAAPEQLLRIVQEMEDAAGRGDLVAVTEADIDFHTELVAASGNPLLIEIYSGVLEVMHRAHADIAGLSVVANAHPGGHRDVVAAIVQARSAGTSISS